MCITWSRGRAYAAAVMLVEVMMRDHRNITTATSGWSRGSCTCCVTITISPPQHHHRNVTTTSSPPRHTPIAAGGTDFIPAGQGGRKQSSETGCIPSSYHPSPFLLVRHPTRVIIIIVALLLSPHPLTLVTSPPPNVCGSENGKGAKRCC